MYKGCLARTAVLPSHSGRQAIPLEQCNTLSPSSRSSPPWPQGYTHFLRSRSATPQQPIGARPSSTLLGRDLRMRSAPPRQPTGATALSITHRRDRGMRSAPPRKTPPQQITGALSTTREGECGMRSAPPQKATLAPSTTQGRDRRLISAMLIRNQSTESVPSVFSARGLPLTRIIHRPRVPTPTLWIPQRSSVSPALSGAPLVDADRWGLRGDPAACRSFRPEWTPFYVGLTLHLIAYVWAVIASLVPYTFASVRAVRTREQGLHLDLPASHLELEYPPRTTAQSARLSSTTLG
ncbi:hypothetical protein BV22DRAFT_472877 [Leucogyrophana mollusca]|uniref:Uncharacterized protein n=1 Tax=Leucogyrophana mollusca TaxID=85980 RepID=A0ACB8BGV5_9AGAM|nr:hypothetical protein BV22DRAFT_472877 [Leucogyrophana mollusca]